MSETGDERIIIINRGSPGGLTAKNHSTDVIMLSDKVLLKLLSPWRQTVSGLSLRSDCNYVCISVWFRFLLLICFTSILY